jgi:hypothetical protein
MKIVRYSLTDGSGLTLEEREAAKQRIQEAAKRPYTYDPDSPLLTEKQLSEFCPVNFDSMEEREQYMKNQNTRSRAQ